MNNLIFKNQTFNYKQTKSILLIIILSGIVLRLFHFIYNRSLWMDEVYLSSSFLHMNYKELATTELDYGQKAPIGFLWLVKFALNTFGINELSLRLISLTTGIISLFMYLKVCKYFLKDIGQVIALTIFSFAPAIIYHSVEIKQYSIECLASIIALYLFIRYKDNTRWRDNLLWGLFGGITLWFSYSVVFILAGIAAALSLYYILRKEWKSLFFYMVPFSMWMISLITNFFLFTYHQADSEWVVYFFKVYDNFMPFPPSSIEQLKWFPRNFVGMMDYPLGFLFPILPSIFLISGFLSLYTDRKKLFVLSFPVLLTLVASGLYLYPLIERFWIFLSPILIIIIAIGFEYYEPKIKSMKIKGLLLVILIISPVIQSIIFMVKPEKFYKHKKSFERESLFYINTHIEKGDAVYNYWNNNPGCKIYQQMYKFKYNTIIGRDFRKTSSSLANYNESLKNDFNKFSGKKRIWVIYNTQFLTDIGDLIDEPLWYYKNNISPGQNLIQELKKHGKIIQKKVYSDVTVYLLAIDKTK